MVFSFQPPLPLLPPPVLESLPARPRPLPDAEPLDAPAVPIGWVSLLGVVPVAAGEPVVPFAPVVSTALGEPVVAAELVVPDAPVAVPALGVPGAFAFALELPELDSVGIALGAGALSVL
jgi:hypothetical protein